MTKQITPLKTDMKIEDFPPKLRKLGMFIINSGQLMTLKEACESTGINYSTIRTQIMRSKKKGNDFNKLVDERVIEKLRNARPEVYKSLQGRAFEGSLGHQKLFSQLIGDYTERQQIDHRHAVIVSSPLSSQVPQDILDKRKEQEEKDKEVIK